MTFVAYWVCRSITVRIYLSGEHDSLVGLTHLPVEDALDEVRAVPEGDEHERLALGPQPVHPAAHHHPLPTVGRSLAYLDAKQRKVIIYLS